MIKFIKDGMVAYLYFIVDHLIDQAIKKQDHSLAFQKHC